MKSTMIFRYALPIVVAPFVLALSSSQAQGHARNIKALTSQLNGGALKGKMPMRGLQRREESLREIYPTFYHHAPQTPRVAVIIPMDADLYLSVQKGNRLNSVKSRLSRAWGNFRASLGVEEGVSLKKQMAKKGLATFLTLTMLTNLFQVSFMGVAWYGFSVKTGMSPFFPGQWKPFSAVFASIMAMDSFFRPIRYVVSIGLAPQADRVMEWLQRKCRGSKSSAVVAAFAGIIVSSLGVFAGAIGLASSFSGVPVFAS